MTPEKPLREYLNMSVHDMKRFRRDRLDKGEDFVWSGYRYEYTESGVKKVCSILNVPVPDLTEEPPEPVEVEVEEFVVERLCPNPTWVQCRVNGELLNVRVVNNSRLVRGRRIRVLHDGRDWREVRARS